MPPRTEMLILRHPRGYRDREAGLFLAQLDRLSSSLWQDLAGITPAELGWQARRGTNTAGMLLAHMAIVEVFWIQRAGAGYDDAAFRRALGIGVDDDGMPRPAGAGPPAFLRGWTLADYRALHRKARAYVKRAAKRYTAADLRRQVAARRRNGDRLRFDVRWMLYHLLEHFAGHYGQILLLRHLYRDRGRRS